MPNLAMFRRSFLCSAESKSTLWHLQLPTRIQNIPFYAAGVIEFMEPLLQTLPPGATVPFPQWSQWGGEYVIQSVTNDIVYYLNAIPAL